MTNNVFEIKDKTGRKIRLTKERWNHITSPISQHTYMANYLEEIEQTLVKPDKMENVDNSKANYYGYYKIEKQYLKVIIKYLNGEGFVITAYFVRKVY